MHSKCIKVMFFLKLFMFFSNPENTVHAKNSLSVNTSINDSLGIVTLLYYLLIIM